MFSIIKEVNESKTLVKHIYANVNVNLMEENVFHINGGITINNNVSLKNVMYVKKVIFGILLHLVVKMKNI